MKAKLKFCRSQVLCRFRDMVTIRKLDCIQPTMNRVEMVLAVPSVSSRRPCKSQHTEWTHFRVETASDETEQSR